MKIDSINSCCTAKILSCFEEGKGNYVEAVGNDGMYKGRSIGTTKQDLLKELLASKLSGYAMVIAFTNDKQVEANAMLREVGFKGTRYAKKGLHPNTKLKLWWMPLEFIEA
jgi:hypothetical protein